MKQFKDTKMQKYCGFNPLKRTVYGHGARTLEAFLGCHDHNMAYRGIDAHEWYEQQIKDHGYFFHCAG